MKIMKWPFLLISFLGTFLNAMAQFQGEVYTRSVSVPVSVNNTNIESPWCGGINATQIAQADLNNDSKKDLILYDFNTLSLKTFICTGLPGQIKYTYSPQYEKNFPTVYDYVLMYDYNCDNVPDLFHRGFAGVAIHKGYYQNNELKFTFYKDLFFQGVNGPVNAYVQPSDIPSIIDIDNDGDLDFFSYEVSGSRVTQYKNLRVEQNLPCDSIVVSEFDRCWGKFFQGIYRSVTTGITCKGGGNELSDKKYRHTGNTLCHLDIDGDGDFDLLGGNISFSDIQLLLNNGNNAILQQDTQYNSNGHKVLMPNWPAVAHTDIDQDGDRDIVVTPHADNNNTANYNNAAWYRNNGTDANPQFVYQHDTLLTPSMIDVGSFSYPRFFDYDKDNKPDLFIGTEGYYNNVTNTLSARLAYYRNTSTANQISFELITKDFLNLSNNNYPGIFPAFGDITGDGVDDLLIGNIQGTVKVFKNFAANNNVTPNFIFSTDSIPGVFVNKYSAPWVEDFNQDGKTDLLVGNQLGRIAYYEDTSSSSQKKLALKTVSLGGVLTGNPFQTFGYATPIITRTDNLPKRYLLSGNNDGMIERYDNVLGNMANFTQIDTQYSLIQTSARCVPAIADLDGDGTFEMVVGNSAGGLLFYKQTLTVASMNDTPNLLKELVLYPNPGSKEVCLQFGLTLAPEKIDIDLCDVQGRKLFQTSIPQGSSATTCFNVPSLQAGVYYVTCTMGNNKITRKWAVCN
jgi:hypothetical protein